MSIREPANFKEYEENITLIVVTHCPEKWLLIDRETGKVYVGNSGGYWDRMDPVEKVDK